MATVHGMDGVGNTVKKPRPHQQQRRSNIVECYKSNDSFDKVECCFDIVDSVDWALVLLFPAGLPSRTITRTFSSELLDFLVFPIIFRCWCRELD